VLVDLLMTYTRATLAEFSAAFPSFAAVTAPQYDFWATRAERTVTDTFGDDQAFASMLMTAHLLESNGLGTGAAAEAVAQGMSEFARVKSGTLELERGASASAGMGVFGATRYGRQLWPMLKAYLGGPKVMRSGTLPCVGAYPWAY
jgi:hypothetical protein